jgi:LacI family transcriptional regulator
MTRRPTIKDVAILAGVSAATVDRVINGRHPVRSDKTQRVFKAAETLGFYATGLIKHRITSTVPQHKVGILLQQPKQQFYQNFAQVFSETATKRADLALDVAVDFLPSQRPNDVVDALRAMAERVEAIAMVAIDHPIINEAVAELRQKQIPVYALLSDFALNSREAYLGVNNLQVGRTGAWFIRGNAKRVGKVALCIGSHRFHGHELRESGFRSYFREYAPEFSLLETLVSLEDDAIMYDATLNLLKRHADLTGLFVAGAGKEGAIMALREERPEGDVAMVCCELTTDTRLGLTQNLVTAVLGTPLPALCDQTLHLMQHALTQKNFLHSGQIFLPFEIFLSENI